jgi:ABC-type uncharacterized transport system permease subunit
MSTMGTGLLLLGAGVAFLLIAVVRNAERHEFAYAMFFGEWGIMNIVLSRIPDGPPHIAVSLVFLAGMLMTAASWYKLFREFKRRRGNGQPTSLA